MTARAPVTPGNDDRPIPRPEGPPARLERPVDRLREPFAGSYEALRHLRFGRVLGDGVTARTLLHLVNDGLIAVFFFPIGLEFKRELLAGELQEGHRLRLLAAGAGFTMSTFIANLSLGAGPESLEVAQLAIVLASAMAATFGYAFLRLSSGDR